jgi:hypothetical protein
MGDSEYPLRNPEGGQADRAGFAETPGEVVTRCRPGHDEGNGKRLAGMENGTGQMTASAVLSITQRTGRGVVLTFFGKIGLDGVDEDELFAAAALVIKPAPFELAVVAEVVDGLDAAGDEDGGFGDADP